MASEDSSFPLDEFSAMVEQHSRRLHAFAVGLLHDHDAASDLVQEVFFLAWRAAQQQAPPFVAGKLDSDRRRWLYHVAYCQALNVLWRRQLIHWQSLDLNDVENTAVLGTEPFEDHITEQAALQSALATLSHDDIACLLLLVVHDFTPAEAAEIMGASAQAVARRLPRARRRLLEAYRAQNPVHPQEVSQ